MLIDNDMIHGFLYIEAKKVFDAVDRESFAQGVVCCVFDGLLSTGSIGG